jgi:hypothetical protein
MSSNNPDDIVTGVKQAVAEEVMSLSPDAKIVLTNYFNHSYMPDLILEWNDAGRRDERPIFLRNDLRPEVTEVEVRSLARREPVVLSLTAFHEPPARSSPLRERAREANRVLVTDVVSLADMATPFGSERSGPRGHGEAPLLRLVQANLLKGGRGLLTPQDVERLAQSAAPTEGDAVLTEPFLTTFQETADEMFVPDAALRLRRSAELLRFGLADEVVDAVTSATGKLSDVELRILVPYLLADEAARSNTRLWGYIGSMMSLDRLEELSDALADVDVTALVIPNLEKWTAKRAQLVINSSFEDPVDTLPELQTGEASQEDVAVSEQADNGEVSEPFWFVRNRLLTADAGQWRLFVASDARRLKGRTNSAPANWDDISPLIRGFALDEVDLRGLSRRIYVGAEGSGDVGADVALIRASIEDSFQVTEIHVRRAGNDESEASLDVDFTEMTVTADHGSAPIAALVSAVELLAHREPFDFSALTASGPTPVTTGLDKDQVPGN